MLLSPFSGLLAIAAVVFQGLAPLAIHGRPAGATVAPTPRLGLISVLHRFHLVDLTAPGSRPDRFRLLSGPLLSPFTLQPALAKRVDQALNALDELVRIDVDFSALRRSALDPIDQ